MLTAVPGDTPRKRSTYLGIGKLLGTPDPLDLVADLLDGIDKTSYVAGNIVEEVDFGHSESKFPKSRCNETELEAAKGIYNEWVTPFAG